MTIEDIIRRIVREEIERAKHQTTAPSSKELRDLLARPCPSCRLTDYSACRNPSCVLRPPITSYGTFVGKADTSVPLYNPPGSGFVELRDSIATERTQRVAAVLDEMIAPRRTGCACPPGTVASCPDATCPWKP